MNTFPSQISKRASKGAALLIVLAFVVLLTGLAVAYFSRTTTDRQLAQSSFNDTTADLLARSALDIVVGDLKQERASAPSVPTSADIQPRRDGSDASIPNLIRRSYSGDLTGRTSTVSSTAVSANGRSISLARWNSHYLIPRLDPSNTATDSTPVLSFTAPDWVLVTAQGPTPTPAPNAVIGRYAFAVYDEGGLLDMNLAGFPVYASQTSPNETLLARRRGEASQILRVVCQTPTITGTLNETGYVGIAFSYQIRVNPGHPATSYDARPLPSGLGVNPTTGLISGTPTIDGPYDVTLYATNECGTDTKAGTVTIGVLPTGGPSPWPVNIARKGIVALTDLRGLRAPNGSSLTPSEINKLVGWRNRATTQQPSSATFDTPFFPPVAATEDLYADYFLDFGSVQAGFITRPFTTVSAATTTSLPLRTDQGLMTRQELLHLRRTIGFSQNLLQYMGTFSRERNQTAPVWPRFNLSKLPDRWDITNFGLIIPDPLGNKVHGKGRGLWRKTPIGEAFGLIWIDGIDADPDTGLPVPPTDPRYYGHWKYIGKPGFESGSTQAARHIPAFRGRPPADFFQILNYALTRANIPDWDPDEDDPDNTHILRALSVGAAIINQYQTADLVDPKSGTRTTIIEYGNEDGTPLYAYGMANEDPLRRPPAAPPPPVGYVFLNRRFENVGEFGYAYDLASTSASHTLDFKTSASNDKPILDFFTYNPVDHTMPRAAVVNLNTQNAPVLATTITGALLNDPGGETVPTALVSQGQAEAAGNAIVAETAARPALTRADVARLAQVAANAVPALAASDETRETITRVLTEVGQTRTWNLMIDVIAQTGKYPPGATQLVDPNDPTKTQFIVEGEKRYWLHIALDRYTGDVLGTQLEEVIE